MYECNDQIKSKKFAVTWICENYPTKDKEHGQLDIEQHEKSEIVENSAGIFKTVGKLDFAVMRHLAAREQNTAMNLSGDGLDPSQQGHRGG